MTRVLVVDDERPIRRALAANLQARGYRGSYETVKRFVRPLRAVEEAAERATVRFETPPGRQSQIDWGQARIYFRSRPVALLVFILTTLGTMLGMYVGGWEILSKLVGAR